MIDFTSSLYLGLRHSSVELGPWSHLTTGKPAVMEPATRAAHLERRFAALTGREAALVAPSTLHLAWDLFGFLARRPVSLYVDEGTYSVLRWGVERAASRGTPVHWVEHHDVGGLRRALRRPGHRGLPVVVCDGLCPSCGESAPLERFLEESDGLLVVDDTQALGVVGVRGGGSLMGRERLSERVLLVSSLAKGFGVPIAALSGDRRLVHHFARESETREHSSPASTASLHAAVHALDTNDACGDVLRARLTSNVRRWKQGVRLGGFATRSDDFPVQTLDVAAPVALRRALAKRGVDTFVARARGRASPTLNFILRADHTSQDVDRATDALRSCVSRGSRECCSAHL